jgi:hypothetical protein
MGTPGIGGRVGCRVGLDVLEQRKISVMNKLMAVA